MGMSVRYFIALAVVLATASSALACPTGARCISDAPRYAEVAGPKRPISLRIVAAPERDVWRLRDEPVQDDTDEVPWLSQVVRTEVVDRITYRNDDGVSLALSPVIVISRSFDTVPGVGISGRF